MSLRSRSDGRRYGRMVVHSMSRDLTALLSLALHVSGNERQLQEAYYSGNDLMQMVPLICFADCGSVDVGAYACSVDTPQKTDDRDPSPSKSRLKLSEKCKQIKQLKMQLLC